MADESETDVLLPPRVVAAIFGVTPKTISRWDESGVLPAQRTPGGHRRFLLTDVERLLRILQEVGGG